MMTNLLSNIRLCEREEYARAARQHGFTFHSLHEGYAVLLEEADEASDEVRNLDRALAALWQATKHDDLDAAAEAAEKARQTALLLAAEAVQTAAMAHKLLNSIERHERFTDDGMPPRQRRSERAKKETRQ